MSTREKGPKVIVAQGRVPAQPAAAHTPGAQPHAQGRKAGNAQALRRGRRHLHGRPLLHPPVRLSVADREGQSRSAQARPGGGREPRLRGLRRVRRSGALPPFSALRFTTPSWSIIPAGSNGPCSACAAGSLASCKGATSASGRSRGSRGACAKRFQAGHRRARRPGRRRAHPVAAARGRIQRLHRAIDLGAGRGPAHRGHALLPRVLPARRCRGRRCGPGAGADAQSRRRGPRGGLRAHGSGPRHAARAGHARPHNAASLQPTASIRSARSRPWATAWPTAKP